MNDIPTALRSLARQEQFLEVVDRDEATARFQQHLKLRPLGAETIPLSEALGRILASAVIADVDVPGFDRSSVDGFAVRADDTTGASERQPKPLVLNAEILTPGTVPAIPVLPGTAALIATGGMMPRGADAVVMVEHTDTRDQGGTTVIDVRRAVVSGQFIAFAGSDLARGETVLRAGQVLTSREIAAGKGDELPGRHGPPHVDDGGAALVPRICMLDHDDGVGAARHHPAGGDQRCGARQNRYRRNRPRCQDLII